MKMSNNKKERRRWLQYWRRLQFNLKLASMVSGAIAMYFIWWGLLLHLSGGIDARIELQSHPEKYGIDPLSENVDYFDQYHVWMAGVATELITLMWLFSLAVLNRQQHRKSDAFDHLCAFFILAMAASICFMYVVNIYVATCGENGYVTRKNNEIEETNNGNKTGVKWSKVSCSWAVVFSADSVSTHDGKDTKYTVGFYGILFIIAMVAAFGHCVVCGAIFLVARYRMTTRGLSPIKNQSDDDALSISSLFSCDSGLSPDTKIEM